MLPDSLLNMVRPFRIDFESHDEHDVFLKDVTLFNADELAQATHVLVGCPQDMGVSRNMGRIGAAKAPNAVRQMLYKFKSPVDKDGVKLLDLGDVDTSGGLESAHERLHSVVSALLREDKKVMVLGGGNDISLPDAHACADVLGEIAAINMDAHLDMRKADRVHSGTPYRNLIEGGHLKSQNFHEVGIQAQVNSPHYLDDAAHLAVNIHTLSHIMQHGADMYFDSLFELLDNKPLFAGLDMDSVRASDAPGVSAPSPIGFTAEEVMNFAARCRAYGKTAVFEITEVNPDMDVDNRTARLAALVLYTYLYGWA